MSGITLHVGISIVQGLVSFGLAMVAALVLYLCLVEAELSLSWIQSAIRKWASVRPGPNVVNADRVC